MSSAPPSWVFFLGSTPPELVKLINSSIKKDSPQQSWGIRMKQLSFRQYQSMANRICIDSKVHQYYVLPIRVALGWVVLKYNDIQYFPMGCVSTNQEKSNHAPIPKGTVTAPNSKISKYDTAPITTQPPPTDYLSKAAEGQPQNLPGISSFLLAGSDRAGSKIKEQHKNGQSAVKDFNSKVSNEIGSYKSKVVEEQIDYNSKLKDSLAGRLEQGSRNINDIYPGVSTSLIGNPKELVNSMTVPEPVNSITPGVLQSVTTSIRLPTEAPYPSPLKPSKRDIEWAKQVCEQDYEAEDPKAHIHPVVLRLS